ncbi:putative ECF RNA polymerase sigma factor SigI [Halomicronema hongdechloris C2206]|uniref:ECF RNA polymerase sigma factor SigI n=1 Tax=Halomicronema hongdechloris C2206 TaxID=1641165 RepID=A0A1Z3HIH6_9CYAN|nr:RNA polymerase sigma-70 factor [Halomicronema hongdechloris]ASC69907.1 putative ECF RNA polymerase sigma factor SigI [Halomicronema hongdechloris C2206]
MDQPDRLDAFRQYRPLLFAIAYRMLSSVADAEDMVQETFIRWQQASDGAIHSAKAYLSSIITRLCIDYLRSARVRREQYVGTWLPEPISTPATTDPAQSAELADTLSTAFLLLLETLSPVERAVFLLREAFDYDYDTIGTIVDKRPENCRQIVRRAKRHLSTQRPRFEPSQQRQEQLVHQFLRACHAGDFHGLMALLSEDITIATDGGGKARAIPRPLQGAAKVARFLLTIRKQKPADTIYQIQGVNGQPGILTYVDRRLFSVATFGFDAEHIRAIFIVNNPDKLACVEESLDGAPRCRRDAISIPGSQDAPEAVKTPGMTH